MNPARQQITAILLVAATVAALLPIPLIPISFKSGKDLSRPFPCQHRPCGCRSAEQCKKKCCCFSAEQKLAWAKKNGVEPSEVVDSRALCQLETAAPTKSCCSSKPVTDQKRSKPISRTVARTAKCHEVVIGVIAQECRGVAQTTSGQLVFLIPPVISVPSLIEPTGDRLIPPRCRLVQQLAEPPVPPPRLLQT